MHTTKKNALSNRALAVMLSICLAVSMAPQFASAKDSAASTTAETTDQTAATAETASTETQSATTSTEPAAATTTATADTAQTAATAETTATAATTETTQTKPAASQANVATAQSDAEATPAQDNATTATDYYAVTFVVDGVQTSHANVAQSSTVTQPDNPTIPSGYLSFVGWFTDANTEWDFSQPVTGDMTLTAKFSDKYLVQFTDADGKVVNSQEVAAGAKATKPSYEPIAPVGKEFTGNWTLSGSVYDFNTAVNGNITLNPEFDDASYVTFVITYITKGSAADPQIVRENSTASQPADPTRAGYTFDHWSATDGGAPFDFANTPITDDTVLYAVWTPDTVDYSVVYWEEKANIAGDPGTDQANYEYYGSDTKQADAGSSVTALEADCPTIKYFTWSYADTQTVAGTGTTVVNVYYKRTLFTVTFNLGTTGSMVFNGVTYDSNNPYSFQAKFQQDIEDLWPSTKNATITNTNGSSFTAWSIPGASYNYASHRQILDKDMLGDLSSGATEMKATALWGTVATVQVNYWLQQIPGQPSGEATTEKDGVTYELSSLYSQKLNMDVSANFVGKSLEGFTTKQGQAAVITTDPDTGMKTYNFYYTRSQFNLTFDSQGGSAVAGVDNVPYNSKLSGYTPADPSRANYVFKGWYYDADCNLPVDMTTDTMPQNNLCLFAKWESSQYNANFFNHPGETTPVLTQGIAQDGYVTNPTALYTVGQGYAGLGEFQGWYWFLPGSNGSTGKYAGYYWETPVAGDVNLYAQWRTSGFKVTYDLGEGSGTAPTDDNSYSVGTKALAADQGDVVAPSGKVFVGWTVAGQSRTYYPGNTIDVNSDLTLTAKYVEPDQAVELTYDSNYMGGPASITSTTVKNDSVLLESNPFAVPGTNWSFAGWSTDPAADAETDTLLNPGDEYRVSEDTTLYAIWLDNTPVDPTETVNVTYAFVGTAPEGATAPDSTTVDKGTAFNATYPAAVKGWNFDGWYTDGACTNKWVDGTALSAETTLYGKWTEAATPTEAVTVDYQFVGTVPTGATVPTGSSLTKGDAFNAAYPAAVAGYVFDGWYTDQACTVKWTDGTAISADTILYGKWTAGTTSTASATATNDNGTKAATASTTSTSKGVATGDGTQVLTILGLLGAGAIALVLARRKALGK